MVLGQQICGQCGGSGAYITDPNTGMKGHKTGWAFQCSCCGSYWPVAKTRTDVLEVIDLLVEDRNMEERHKITTDKASEDEFYNHLECGC
jgi:hypothetical protein